MEGDLSGREMAGAAAAAAAGGVALSWDTGQREARWEEAQTAEKTLAERRRAEAHWEGRSLGMEEEGRA